ncbi:MAG: NIPSNAP family protein [Bryobacteraceae bacterium]|nr:NIPSNAP family protein [Bryobacteraceae bacterium]
MDRRDFLTTAGGILTMSQLAPAADAKPMILELTKIWLRNTTDSMVQRTNEYVGKGYFPALQRAGITPAGAFSSLIAPDSPFLLLLTQYASLSAWDAAGEKLAADREFQKGRETYFAGPLQYMRFETTLLRGFRTLPGIEAPSALPDAAKTRVYELRTYESNNTQTLTRKIKMFDEGEIAIFRKVGMVPVFFGETIAGRNMPNLTYMVGFDDLAARERVWGAFVSSPEWQKLRAQAGLSDGEVVSNISNILVKPLAFSAIK